MILVTGGSGFLGRPLCQKLALRNEPIICLDLTHRNEAPYKTVTADIRDQKEIEKVFDQHPIDIVVNLAAILESASSADPLLSFQVNVEGTFNLLKLSQEHSVSRFIFGSSLAALGNPVIQETPITEDVPPQPTAVYGQTKAFVEKMGILFSSLSGCQFISARMPIIVGPGQPTETSAWRAEIFHKLSLKGKVQIHYAPDEMIPLAHHADVAEALTHLTLAESIHDHIFHLPFERWRVRELGRTLKEINPQLQVEYGQLRLNSSPVSVSWSKMKEKFGLSKPSLKNHLQDYKKKVNNSF
ncbi:MAG: NAD(P)-dependent oxidoreductase [Anaerolineales bacterium]